MIEDEDAINREIIKEIIEYLRKILKSDDPVKSLEAANAVRNILVGKND